MQNRILAQYKGPSLAVCSMTDLQVLLHILPLKNLFNFRTSSVLAMTGKVSVPPSHYHHLCGLGICKTLSDMFTTCLHTHISLKYNQLFVTVYTAMVYCIKNIQELLHVYSTQKRPGWSKCLALAIERPSTHIRVPGFNSWFQLLTPASCRCRPWEGAVNGSGDLGSCLPWGRDTWLEVLTLGFGCGWELLWTFRK